MKKYILLMVLLLCTVQVHAMTANEYWAKRAYIGAQNQTLDPLYTLFGDVDDVLGTDGVLSISNILFDSTVTSDPTATEGRLYYNASSELLRLRKSGSWVNLATESGTVSLNVAYGNGVAITVDNGAVALTATNAADNVVLAIDQEDTGGTVAQTIVNAGTGAALSFDSNGAGVDVLGSDSSWTITKAGGITAVAGTFSGDFTLDGAGADIIFTAATDILEVEDDAAITFGDAGDVSVSWNATNLLIEAATDNTGQIIFGSTNAMDIVINNDAADSTILADISGEDLILNGWDITSNDGDFINFGDSKDFTMTATNTVFTWQGALTNETDIVNMGADQDGIDLTLFGATASSTVLWDASADKLIFNGTDVELQDADILNFGDSQDITIAFDGGNGDLDILGSGLEISFGVTDEGIDVIWHGEAAGDHMKWDEGIDCLLFEDSHIKFDDDAVLYIGTKTNNQTLDGDFKIESASDTSLLITAVVANSEITIGDGTVATDFRLNNITTAGADFHFDQSADTAAGTIYIGIDGKGIDTKFFGEAASSYLMWDMSADQLNAVDSDVVLDDESLFVDIIDTTGTKVEVGTPFYIIFKPTATEDLAYVVPAAYDLLIIDAWGYKTAGAGANADDEWLLTNDEGGAANIFAQVELNGVGDGDRVAFTDMDDAEAEVNGGQTLTLNADENAGNGCDGIITVVCVLKLTD